MRILAAFFTILFTFINPVMILKVVSEVERILHFPLKPNLQFKLVEAIIESVSSNHLTGKIKTIIYISVLTATLLHIGLTCMCLYGIYSCRPALVRPLLFDIVFSFFFLLVFVIFSLCMYWKLNSNGTVNDHDFVKHHLRLSRNLYVGAAFLFTYAFWLIVSISGYRDTKKMHADFMYWIVEERMSMRSHVHNVSTDNRSDRSSKGSKASRTSKGSSRSVRSEHWAHSRPNSVTASVGTICVSDSCSIEVTGAPLMLPKPPVSDLPEKVACSPHATWLLTLLLCLSYSHSLNCSNNEYYPVIC